MTDRTVDPAPNGHTRCKVCVRWTWCARPTDEKPDGCDADDHGERESSKKFNGRA
jgi:hypothetical protein